MQKAHEEIEMQGTPERADEFERFDTTVRKVMSISPDELRQRKQRWSMDREERKRGKAAAPRVSFTEKH